MQIIAYVTLVLYIGSLYVDLHVQALAEVCVKRYQEILKAV